MILIDTSVWIDFLGNSRGILSDVLAGGDALVHPFSLGELALGSIRDREEVLSLLKRLPTAKVARDVDVLGAIDSWSLAASGLGYVDAHLLCSVSLMPGSQLWTHDKKLHEAATRLGVAMVPH